MGKRALLPLLVGTVGLATAVRADRKTWYETDSWSGTGMKTTREFLVGAGKWRIVARREADEPRRIWVLDDEGNRFGSVIVLLQGVPAVKPFKGQGRYRLVVPDEDGVWSVKVQQKLSVVEEWDLRQALKEPAPALRKISAWSGGDGRTSYRFSVPQDVAWKLVCRGTAGEAGELRLRVTPLETTEGGDFIKHATGEFDIGQWFVRGGEFELTVGSTGAEWQAEVHTE
jgi:hypothetical protein